MHERLLTGVIDAVRKRYDEGDCPVTECPRQEVLENAILELASQRESAIEACKSVAEWGNGIDPRIRQMCREVVERTGSTIEKSAQSFRA